jgi:hypothetical protein
MINYLHRRTGIPRVFCRRIIAAFFEIVADELATKHRFIGKRWMLYLTRHLRPGASAPPFDEDAIAVRGYFRGTKRFWRLFYSAQEKKGLPELLTRKRPTKRRIMRHKRRGTPEELPWLFLPEGLDDE